jgi:hypothetical protein
MSDMRGKSLAELVAFMVVAELLGADCHWLHQSPGAFHYAIHYAVAFSLGIWCAGIATRAEA